MAANGVLEKGQWYIVSAVSTTNQFTAGTITGISDNIVSIGNVGVPTANPQVFGGDDEQITTTIRLGTGSGNHIDLKTVQSLSKSKAGAVGNIINFAFVKVAPEVSASDVVALGSNSLPNQFTVGSATYTWSDDIPAGTDILYASKGQLASGSTAYNWGTPFRITAQSAAELVIYTANVQTGAAPNVPTGSTFKFSDSTLTINDANWSLNVPTFTASGQTIYAARALVTGSADGTVSITWSTAFVFAQRIDGEAGDAVDAIFKRSNDDPPATPSPSANTPTGWSTNAPAGTAPLWMSIGEKESGQTNYTWGPPTQIEGEAFVEVFAYRVLLASAPNAWNPAVTPSATTWNFTNNTFATPANWSQNQPSLANHGDKLYVILGTASGGATNTGATLTWSAPVLQQIRQDGADGVAVTLTPSPATVIYNKDSSGTFDPNGTNSTVTVNVTANVTGITSPTYTWSIPSGATFNSNVASLDFAADKSKAQAQALSGNYTFTVNVSGTDSNGDAVSVNNTSIIVPVSIGGDADDGNNAPKVATGFVYNTSDANDPETNFSGSYSFNPTSPGFSGLTNGWTENPPTFNSTNNEIYYSRYTVTENVNSTTGVPTGTGTGNNIQFGSVQTGTSFTGLVTFASNQFSTEGNNNFFDITAIDGGNITTGTIKSNGAAVGGSTSFTADGGAFTSTGSYFNLTNGVIATKAFRVDSNGVGQFSGGIVIGQSSSMSSSLTVGSGSGSVTLKGSNQRFVINDGSQDRVILGKLT